LQRDDGLLVNKSVHAEALSTAVLALIKASANGYNVKGSWTASTAYAVGDLVEFSQATYLCFEAHTSGDTFGANSAKFILLANAAIQTTASAVDQINGDGSTQTFTLTNNAPSGVTDVLVFVNGELRTPTTQYTVTSNSITFATAPSSGTNNIIVWGTSTVVEAAKQAAIAARDTAETHRDDANEHKQTANLWANKVDGTVTDVDTSVDSGEYSAKAYAQSEDGNTPTGGSSKGWAQTAKNTQVPGAGSTDRSAKHYSEVAADHVADAESAKLAAESARDAAEGYTDSFDDRYLGAKASAPTLDNDGDTLLDGALYYNTTSNVMYVYDTGTTNWIAISTQGLTLSNFAESEIVTESEGISSNDSDTKIPTTAAVKDYVDTNNLSLIDEDDMATDSATRPPSQQSVKAYADQLAFQGEPHIIPGVLYPAVAGKLLDGSTSHSGNYGTAQSDGRSYYYTDIKGSKPIKDPRIGGHFGSQRHKTKSLQLLEQETATHGENIYSVDGREWCRGHLAGTSYGSDFAEVIYFSGTDTFLEITGYFSDANIIFHNILGRNVRYTLDGVDDTTDYAGQVSVTTPLAGRYVEAGGVENLGLGATLGIHTLKLRQTTSGHGNYMVGFELIAQDTSNRNNIQIPSQNVVSFGKKFSISAEGSSGHHYDPFNGFVNGTSLHSAFVDTATSLGLDSAPGSSAKWAISSTNHIRPYQGGRVVKWVDSDGTIKTSVNMIPPNAQNFSSSADSEVTTPSATNTNFKPAFSDDTIDFQNSEVAKTFFAREMGNGGANGDSSYRDATVADSDHNIAYVLDDGLTSLSAEAASSYNNFAVGSIGAHNSDFDMYFTFIGSGIGYYGKSSQNNIASNLPYGSHILKIGYDGTNSTIDIDGVQVFSGSANERYYSQYSFNIHQPKRPPIPEDACVIADYMLMADHVVASTANAATISKGVRRLSPTRDVYYKDGTWTFYAADSGGTNFSYGMGFYASGDSDHHITAFATNAIVGGFDFPTRFRPYEVDGSVVTTTKTGTGAGSIMYPSSLSTLGVHTFGADGTGTSLLELMSYDLVTPIHTSSHYQPFETPFLHELVGGDRNMEQTNLVCSPDGKTWDELTRDVSYLGNVVISASRDGGDITADGIYFWDYFRGSSNSKNYFNKQFAIMYGKLICLEEGFYEINVQIRAATAGNHLTAYIRVNDTNENFMDTNSTSGEKGMLHGSLTVFLKRGDIFDLYRDAGSLEGGTLAESHLIVKKV
jgi:hypothetical protein